MAAKKTAGLVDKPAQKKSKTTPSGWEGITQSGAVTSKMAYTLAIEKLATSGLGEDDFKELKLQALGSKEATEALGFEHAEPGLGLTYWDPRDLSKPLSVAPKWPQYLRVRKLHEIGAVLTENQKKYKYLSSKGSGCAAYFPPNADWPSIIQDVSKTIIITEGELKAAKTTREGYPTIGLGGVNSYSNRALGSTFLKELDYINWVKRNVPIMFDSDIINNDNIVAALNKLADELIARGAIVFTVIIPMGPDGKKQGLDDWFVNNPNTDFTSSLLKLKQPIGNTKTMFDFNEQYLYVNEAALIVKTQTGARMKVQSFKESTMNQRYSDFELQQEGHFKITDTKVSDAWLNWPLRNTVENVTYAPGKPEYVDNGDNTRSYNIWPGLAVEPAKGDVKPFVDLFNHLMDNGDPAHEANKKWFMQWLAYPLQHPGTKLLTAVVMHGTTQGTGKTLLGTTMGRIYGKNYIELSQSDIDGPFNSWAEGRQFIVGEEIVGSNSRGYNDRFKKIITQSDVRINAKNMPEYVVPDFASWYFTSNHLTAFFLEDTDRRMFINATPAQTLGEKFYDGYARWMNSTGPSHLLHHLLNVDLVGFNPHAPAPMTMSKKQMALAGKSEIAAWIDSIKEDPENLRVGNAVIKGDLIAFTQLFEAYQAHLEENGMLRDNKVTLTGFARQLQTAGLKYVNYGANLKVAGDVPVKYFAMHNQERWLKADTNELVEQIALQRGKSAQRAKKKY
jgi:Family of unknown function (DUF5906)/Domain of unknown function (DUF3854)